LPPISLRENQWILRVLKVALREAERLGINLAISGLLYPISLHFVESALNKKQEGLADQ